MLREEDEYRKRIYKTVFATSEGRWVLLDIINASGFLKSIITNDPIEMAKTVGKREVALSIVDDLALDSGILIDLYPNIEHMRN
ncbi:MAG: hypothetical protein C4617_04745 [Candidatus Liberibacter europaeus]|uniref:Bbp19-like phage domain-containing protein n=1 Tax=Candidatus Liberibacter europaeus TaxID=744859 RepID=A0A2T4VWT3_9HYPH|nr:hypothetical protein [Candidatus Liberibacter europaeus]PTL86236.1 MAG: hypothetical protein C4617_04745 [Candidatus Liberibacter europaeus]